MRVDASDTDDAARAASHRRPVRRQPRCRWWPAAFRVLVLTRATLAVTACGGNDGPAARLEVSDSAGVRLTTISVAPSSLPVWTLHGEPRFVLTGTETGDETAFAVVGSVRFLAGGGVVVADAGSSRLIVYDAQGRFMRMLGGRGEGPGEIRRLEAMTVKVGDTVATYDPGLRRLSFWRPDSGFVRSLNLAGDGSLESVPSDAMPWRDSLVVVMERSTVLPESGEPPAGTRLLPTRMILSLRNGAGTVLHTSPAFAGVYTGLTERGDIRLPFSNRPFAALGPDRVYFGSGDKFEISLLDPTWQVAGVIRWPVRDERLTGAEVEAVRGEAVALISRRPLPPNPFADHFAPDVLPANRPSIGRVLADAEGRLWIERFEAIRMGTALQAPGDQWSVLRADGLPIAILRLPARTRLEDVRGDEVVVVRRDSLDIQTVVVLRLRR